MARSSGTGDFPRREATKNSHKHNPKILFPGSRSKQAGKESSWRASRNSRCTASHVLRHYDFYRSRAAQICALRIIESLFITYLNFTCVLRSWLRSRSRYRHCQSVNWCWKVQNPTYSLPTAQLKRSNASNCFRISRSAVLLAEYQINGDAIARAIKNDLPQIPVIALLPREAFTCPGADHHLSSHNPEHLIQFVRELLGDPRTIDVQKNKTPL